ncbi:MAG: peptidylprolyl isomerase [Cyanobacteria bacterium P01_A01_bin.45]
MTAVEQEDNIWQETASLQESVSRAAERLSNLTSNELLLVLNQYGMLPQLVREMLIDCAIANINLTQEETLEGYKKFYQQQQLNSDADLEAWLASKGISKEQLEYMTTRSLKLTRFQQQTWANKIESYFLQRKQQLDRVVYSLIRVKDIYLAQELYFRIQEGEQSFSDVAREHSQGPEAQTGGLLGPVDLAVPHPVLAKILTRSEPGQLVPPTRLGDWVLIVRLEKFLPAQLDNSMRQKLLNELFEEWIKAESSSVVKNQLTPKKSDDNNTNDSSEEEEVRQNREMQKS